MTPADWLASIRKSECPACHGELLAGPIGGESRNLYCAQCVTGWNAHGVRFGIVSVESIGHVTAELLELARRSYPQPWRFEPPPEGVPEKGIYVRVQAASDKKKQRNQLEALRAAGGMQHAMIVAERDGQYTVLGQGMDLEAMISAISAAAQGIGNALANEHAKDSNIRIGGTPPPQSLPLDATGWGRKRTPEIARGPEGDLQAPQGETFIFCRECGAAKWFLTQTEWSGAMARAACTSCGNELKFLHGLPPESRA